MPAGEMEAKSAADGRYRTLIEVSGAIASQPNLKAVLESLRRLLSLGLVRAIERHSDELAAELIVKLETSSRTADLRKAPIEELRRGIHDILRHFGDWLITKTGLDIQKRYF